MNNLETLRDVEDALHIAQTDRDKWKARAEKLAKMMDIMDYQIDTIEECKYEKIKTGHWEEHLVRGSKALYCSACGCGIDVIYEYDYCPNCGARMEEAPNE